MGSHPALDQIIALIKESETFCLSGHQNPDGDVIGSELAMASLIKRIGPKKRVDIMNDGPVPQSVSFLPGAAHINNVKKVDGKYDAQFVFECSGADRMGNIIDFKSQVGKVVNIDHHLHNPNFGHINFVEPTTSSTCELIFKIFEHANIKPSADEAICMYTGLVTDTGWFRFGNTNPQSHRIAGELIAAGIKVEDLAERIYMSKTKTALPLLAWIMSHMSLHYNDQLAVLRLPEAVFKELSNVPDDVEGVVNQGLLIDSVKASVLLKEKTNPRVVKVSLRSKGTTDINQVARVFGGGGHRNASGCQIEMDMPGAEQAILKEMKRVFPTT